MRNLTISAFALLTSSAFAQTGNTWGDLMTNVSSGIIDPPTWPAALEGIHMCHIWNPADSEYGRIVMWGHGFANDSGGKDTYAHVWDTELKAFIDQSGSPYIGVVAGMVLPNINLFCAGHTGDKDGNMFVAGGEVENHSGHGIKSTAKFLASSLSWTVEDEMTHARWYPTVVPLADTSLLAVAGTNETGVMSDKPERFTFTNPSNQWSPFNAVVENPPGSGNWDDFDSDFYPFMFTIHNSGNPLVFWAGKRRHSLNQGQVGLRSHMLNMATQTYIEFPANPTPQQTPKEGSGAVIWINGTATAKKGTVIKAGGNGLLDPSPPTRDPRYIATNETWYIDLDATTPVWATAGNMVTGATDNNLVWLPTGKLLSLGGATFDHGWILKYGNITHSVRTTQIYDPVAKTWADTQMPMPGSEKRWYHSTANLVPDGSVLSAGSNNEYNGRIYYPSYFGQTRPAITSAPSTISYGQGFNVGVDMNGLAFGKVTLIRLNATTHGYDQGQRLIVCDVAASVDNLTVTPPANSAIAPPGYYMLFVVSTNDRPSHARYVKIG